MITKSETTIFICEYCKKVYQKSHACINHEKWCSKNPGNLAKCGGCSFLEEREKEVYHENYYASHTTTHKSFFCLQKQIEVYPLVVARLRLPDKYPEDFYEAEKMPSECGFFSSNLPY